MAEDQNQAPGSGGSAGEPLPVLSQEDGEELIRAIGLVFARVPLYGMGHRVTAESIRDCHRVFSVALDLFGEVSFQLMDDSLMINQTAVDRKNPLVEAFVRHLTDRELSNFSLGKGVTLETFTALMEILNAKPDDLKRRGGFAQAAREGGLEKVKSSSMIYKRVAEDEVVVSKDEAGGAGGAADVKVVLSFLRGAAGAPADEDAVRNVRQLASSNAEKLGEVIVDAAQSRQADARDTERDVSLTQMVVDSLKRIYAQLSTDPTVKTQKGRKDLARTLTALEEQVRERIAAIDGELSEADAQLIGGTVETMTDELKIDALVTEYMKKRSAIDDNEKRLLRFMKAKGLDRLSESELEQRLLASGLTPDGWRELLAKSGIEMDPGSGGALLVGGLPVVGHLAELLAAIQTSVGGTRNPAAAGAPVPDVRAVLEDIDQEVKTMVARTKVKIQNLVTSAREDAPAAEAIERLAEREGKLLQMPRRKLMQVLAEIVQEICQPLAVVSCSLDMLASGALGAIPESQAGMLKLAAESTDKLKVLTDNLLNISGLPTTMTPDSGIQKALYDKS